MAHQRYKTLLLQVLCQNTPALQKPVLVLKSFLKRNVPWAGSFLFQKIYAQTNIGKYFSFSSLNFISEIIVVTTLKHVKNYIFHRVQEFIFEILQGSLGTIWLYYTKVKLRVYHFTTPS